MSKSKNSAKKEQYILKRKQLIELSNLVRPLVQEGEFDTVNEAIKEQYLEQYPEIEVFKTFHQWKQGGATVRKGEKAFLVWGQPRRVEQVPEGSDEPEEFKYWPLCYLFANTQVYQPDESKEPQQQPQFEAIEAVSGDDL